MVSSGRQEAPTFDLTAMAGDEDCENDEGNDDNVKVREMPGRAQVSRWNCALLPAAHLCVSPPPFCLSPLDHCGWRSISKASTRH
jgi:hypothetical protein